jgi:hypothetical protein
VSEADHQAEAPAPEAADPGPEPGTPEPARLRRRPFGYRRGDVDEALQTRDSQLAELRQDIAALWLAFAQHDRMLRELAEKPGQPEREGPDAPPASAATPLEPSDPESVGRQLSDLDEVLAAIEMATQTLERTYSEEIAEPPRAAGTEPATSEDASEQGGRTGSP